MRISPIIGDLLAPHSGRKDAKFLDRRENYLSMKHTPKIEGPEVAGSRTFISMYGKQLLKPLKMVQKIDQKQ